MELEVLIVFPEVVEVMDGRVFRCFGLGDLLLVLLAEGRALGSLESLPLELLDVLEFRRLPKLKLLDTPGSGDCGDAMRRPSGDG
mmetsp:Transcript_41674/g.99260  ORF Transcript_41674/g.99260 Transcript_41674/m.99260 type:complete len:85 (-) Transcript_41674:39-293(-)